MVLVQMRSTDSAWLSKSLRHNNERNYLLVSGEAYVVWALEVTAERYYHFLRMNNYKVSKESLKRKLSEQVVILKTMTASMKQPEKKLSSTKNEKRLLKKTNQKVRR